MISVYICACFCVKGDVASVCLKGDVVSVVKVYMCGCWCDSEIETKPDRTAWAVLAIVFE